MALIPVGGSLHRGAASLRIVGDDLGPVEVTALLG
jgi:hypothetical protein